MIIKKTNKADTRSCDSEAVTKNELLSASETHIENVRRVMSEMRSLMEKQNSHVPDDVNLIDVLEMLIDLVVVRKERGIVFPISISDDVLKTAFLNTIVLISYMINS